MLLWGAGVNLQAISHYLSLFCRDLTQRGACLINAEILVLVLPQCLLFYAFKRVGFSFENDISFVLEPPQVLCGL